MAAKFEIAEGAYPPHIHDNMRAEVAITYVRHELRKYLTSIEDKFTWGLIDSDVNDWFGTSMSLRDFWNGVHGIAMGFKLQNGMMQNITAENVSWRKEDFAVEQLHFASDQSHWTGVEGLSAREILDYYSKSDTASERGVRSAKARTSVISKEGEHDPIIVLQKKRDGEVQNSIYDGNRRVSLAVLDGREKVLAYIGEYTTEDWGPKNFWLPTSFLMDLVQNGELGGAYDETLNILRKLIALSKSGEYELRERVLVGKNEFRMRLKKDLFGV
jgi:hypothetical protein